MTRPPVLLAFLIAATSLVAPTSAAAADKDLALGRFDGKDPIGWYAFIEHADKSVASAADPKGTFRVEDDVLMVSGEEMGCLTTRREYGDYKLRLEMKWGTKKWPPRLAEKRDSGILMHCTGPDKIWTKSIECQIQEGDCGDFHLVDGTTIDVAGKTAKGRVVKTSDAEKPNGEWNVVEVICDGDTITNSVNGVVVNRATRASVARGRIVLQSEGAEVSYRNITITPLAK